MTSILTNNGAMVALQTLKSINNNLETTQNEISTGKKVSSAKDNAATWAISKVMEADVSGFKAISDSLSLGESTVATGRNAAESVTDLLTEIKGKITGAQEENVDRNKLQTDIEALTSQIKGIVGAAQFNGLNLLDGSAKDPVKVLSSLNRASDGSVTSSSISVDGVNLSTDGGDALTLVQAAETLSTGGTAASTAVALTFQGGGTEAMKSSDKTADTSDLDTILAGDVITVTIDADTGDDDAGIDVSYRVGAGDTAADVVKGMNDALKQAGIADITASDSTGLVFTNSTDADISVATSIDRGRGDMFALSSVDVTTAEGAASALSEIEGLIQKSVNSAAELGSVEKRISIQNEFVGKLTDSLKSGIGSLVDADMEEASAKLKALQTQQQLGVQSLSIANQAPGAISQLFR